MGAGLGIFSISGPWMLSSLLSISALVLIFLSKDDFKGEGEYNEYTRSKRWELFSIENRIENEKTSYRIFRSRFISEAKLFLGVFY